MGSAGDFQVRIVGTLYFIPFIFGVLSGFPYSAISGA